MKKDTHIHNIYFISMILKHNDYMTAIRSFCFDIDREKKKIFFFHFVESQSRYFENYEHHFKSKLMKIKNKKIYSFLMFLAVFILFFLIKSWIFIQSRLSIKFFSLWNNVVTVSNQNTWAQCLESIYKTHILIDI